MKCPNCGNELLDGAQFCDECGQRIINNHGGGKRCFCGNCGAEIEAGAEFCGICGSRIDNAGETKPTHIFCGNCGAEIDANAEFCANCGAATGFASDAADLDHVVKPKQKSSKGLLIIIAAVIAAIVLAAAAFAVYKFYFSDDETDREDNTSTATEQISGSPADTESAKGTADKTPLPTEPPTPTPIPAPVFTYVSASSTRGTDTEGGRYSAEAVLRSDKTTKWVPSKQSSNGISEWIQINAADAQVVSGIEILNGYQKDFETWNNNNRVKNCTLSFGNGQSKTVTLDDTMDLIKIQLDSPVSTTYIKLTINSVYNGAKWNDTAITYLYAY